MRPGPGSDPFVHNAQGARTWPRARSNRTPPAPDTGRAVTIHDVARYAGVASMTVSRVVNGNSYVSDAMRERVQAAIKALNYSPNLAARNTRAGSTGPRDRRALQQSQRLVSQRGDAGRHRAELQAGHPAGAGTVDRPGQPEGRRAAPAGPGRRRRHPAAAAVRLPPDHQHAARRRREGPGPGHGPPDARRLVGAHRRLPGRPGHDPPPDRAGPFPDRLHQGRSAAHPHPASLRRLRRRHDGRRPGDRPGLGRPGPVHLPLGPGRGRAAAQPGRAADRHLRQQRRHGRGRPGGGPRAADRRSRGADGRRFRRHADRQHRLARADDHPPADQRHGPGGGVADRRRDQGRAGRGLAVADPSADEVHPGQARLVGPGAGQAPAASPPRESRTP
jgi:transcriptional regulator with XRE-family HTH domain